ncbi:MAG TPA: alanine racemase [Thermoanaerobaculia bacterium]|nr:alanine racemase [Thermoanaerobaculia bacterium]
MSGRPTYAEISLGAFRRNLDAVAHVLPERSRIIAVLKANAYGHGAVPLARECARHDRVGMIAVALLEEALELRAAGIALPLLVLGPLTREQLVTATEQRITAGVVGPEELAAACDVARERDVAVHLKLDSGMGRMGLIESDLRDAAGMIRAAPRLRIDAIYTHYANASDPLDPFTDTQTENFQRMLATLGVDAPLHHAANSAATMRGIVAPGDNVRTRIVLLGAAPLDNGQQRLEPVLRWRTEIARLKILPPGHGIGYGTTFHTARESRIATLPVGYADGYSRLLSNRGEVFVRGRRAPVVGRVSMDLLTVDVTDVPGAALGDEVVLLGGDIPAEEHAAHTGTIAYEVFCRISARVPRVYKQ